MNLAKWRRSKGWTQEELAKRLNVSQGHISTLERRIDPQVPSRDLAKKIYALSGGLVTPNDFHELPAIDAPARDEAA